MLLLLLLLLSCTFQPFSYPFSSRHLSKYLFFFLRIDLAHHRHGMHVCFFEYYSSTAVAVAVAEHKEKERECYGKEESTLSPHSSIVVLRSYGSAPKKCFVVVYTKKRGGNTYMNVIFSAGDAKRRREAEIFPPTKKLKWLEMQSFPNLNKGFLFKKNIDWNWKIGRIGALIEN